MIASNGNNMSKQISNSGGTLKAMGLILCLGALPFLSGVIGCAGNRYTQSTGEHVDDHATSSRVSCALRDDSQHKYFEGVNVETFKGVVQLSGFVNTQDEKNKAEDIARGVRGVKSVKNNLIVKSK